MHEGGNLDEQKVSLRALVTVSKSGPVTLVARVVDLLANDNPVPGALTGVRDVAERMAAHSIHEIRVGGGSTGAELLGLARIIAADAQPGDGGAGVAGKLAALRANDIAFVKATGPDGLESAAVARPAPAPVRGGQESFSLPSLPTERDATQLTPAEVFAALDGATTAEAVTHVLDDLVSLAEHSVRMGKPGTVGELLYGASQREAGLGDAEMKRAYGLALRRLTKPATLRAVATLIPRKPEKRQQYYEVLVRAGADGAEAVIEQITQAQTHEDRRRLFEVLQLLDNAVPALKRMLGDSRWFVVRNAADLLGELAVPAGEDALVALLHHGDDRVRRSATNALLKLGTPNALRGIYEAFNDSSPEVRMQATAAIATKKDGKTAITLIRAIEDEQDTDVQLAIIAALGRVATADAVQKLVKLAEPETRLFRKKAINIRVAAAQALGEARTPAALAALRSLVEDKDRDVRDMATRALAHTVR